MPLLKLHNMKNYSDEVFGEQVKAIKVLTTQITPVWTMRLSTL